MPADRFFYPGPLTNEALISLTGAEHHHMRVMRITVGQEVQIVNGKGALAQAKVLTLQSQATQVQIHSLTQETASSTELILIVPLMRPSKLEWIVEKGTELGMSALYLYAADFSEKMQLSPSQLERLQTICLAALKQSGRLFLPSIELLPSLKRAMIEERIYYFGDLAECKRTILEAARSERTALITGPERGFSEKEKELLTKAAIGVILSPHILRAETAPLAGLSVLALKNFSL